MIGTWKNQTFGQQHGKDVGGQDNPLSYNVMPLPQESAPNGYILKNFTYYETIHFNDCNADTTLAIGAGAPNRGGHITQDCRVLFYEQQVRFAEGPAQDSVVHVENGAWLYLPRFVQRPGPYPNDPMVEVPDSQKQPIDMNIAKQIAVPHGNSILALGAYDTVSSADGEGVCKRSPKLPGRPVIPDAPFPYPLPADEVLDVDYRYSQALGDDADFQNPHPELTQCVNQPLQQAVHVINPNAYLHWRVTTRPLGVDIGTGREVRGHVTNIPFEQRVAEVTDYFADYWMLSKDHGTTYPYLAYTQTILMRMRVKVDDEFKEFIFAHVTCNTLTKI